MKTLDFILSNDAMVASIAKEIANGGLILNGKTVKHAKVPSPSACAGLLRKASEEELVTICEDFGWEIDTDAVAETPSVVVAINTEGEDIQSITTAEGVTVDVIMLEFIGHSESGESLKFKMKNGNVVTHSGDKLRQLEALGGLPKGAMLGFKPESIQPTRNIGYYVGIPNFASSPNLLAVLQANSENKRAIKAQIAQLRALGLPKSTLDARINELTSTLVKPITLVKPKFV